MLGHWNGVNRLITSARQIWTIVMQIALDTHRGKMIEFCPVLQTRLFIKMAVALIR